NAGRSSIMSAVNYRVSLDYESNQPWEDFIQSLRHIDSQQGKLLAQHTAGFMTAAKLTHAAIAEYTQQDFAMLVLATAGTSNAVRAGVSRPTYRGYHAGTINIFLWIDARMSEAAIVNAIMTATEA